MEKIAFLYFNSDNEVACSEYFRLQDGVVVNYIDTDEGVKPMNTEYTSFEDLAAYYDTRSQAMLIFNVVDPEKAQDVLGTSLADFKRRQGHDADEQKLADDLEKSGVFEEDEPGGDE